MTSILPIKTTMLGTKLLLGQMLFIIDEISVYGIVRRQKWEKTLQEDNNNNNNNKQATLDAQKLAKI